MSLPSATEITDLITILAPGLVILGIRQWFVAAPLPKLADRTFSYAAASIIYFSLASPLALFAGRFLESWVVHTFEYLLVPALIGLGLGIAEHKDVFEPFWERLKIRPVHHAPTAWDYAFTRLSRPPYVLATLSDGSQVAGEYTKGSFAASNSNERDLLIMKVYDSDPKPWKLVSPARSILLCGRDIRFIEFFQEPTNGESHPTPSNPEALADTGAEGVHGTPT